MTLENIGSHDEAIKIYNSVINVYEPVTKVFQNNLLWNYSAYLATRGMDIFENERTLPVEYVWMGLGSTYHSKGLYVKAIKVYTEAISILQDNSWLQTRLQNACEEQHPEGTAEAAHEDEVV